jgi:hypothetical protein
LLDCNFKYKLHRLSRIQDFLHLCKDAKSPKNELYYVISGKSQVSIGATIQAITRYLNDGTYASSKAESSKQIREQETKRLKNFIS